ncbi:MAG: phosphoribosylformimino-5-aminoimidazole carboxamide ribotide isomerase [Lachnospiraceae bacterium]|nr:phosphoribosylformimino-5-aminoimidazole carboxamide ribotide isomerase [Lachnospiraceae bacterium]
MIFRPCIDIHNGKVKQIVGSSLRDEGDFAKENFVSDKSAASYAGLYKRYGLTGGHVIMLNGRDSEYRKATEDMAYEALGAYPGGLMAGGGIGDDNAASFLDAGASHVIVTSYVFSGGVINMDNLSALVRAVGSGRIVLDLSCKRTDEGYMVTTDRWQKMTRVKVDANLFDRLGKYCDGFLVHAVDAEGKASGIDEELTGILAGADRPVCYAGGISSLDDIARIKKAGKGRVDFTVGSKLDIFGGNLSIEEIIECTR